MGEEGGVNLYEFAYNNSNVWIDPFGLYSDPTGKYTIPKTKPITEPKLKPDYISLIVITLNLGGSTSELTPGLISQETARNKQAIADALQERSSLLLDVNDENRNNDSANFDTGSVISYISYKSSQKSVIDWMTANKNIVLTHTALSEIKPKIRSIAGPIEKQNFSCFMKRVTVVPDNPSERTKKLKTTRILGPEDIIIFGTGDSLNILTVTADAKAVSAMANQGVLFYVLIHKPVPLKGM